MSVAPDVLALLVDLARAHAAARPDGRLLVLVDGPAGSGKTTLAAQLGDTLPATVVHMDDLYEGWEGVEEGVRLLQDDVLEPWSAGEPASYRPYDWHARRRAAAVSVAPGAALVVEGCHAGRRATTRFDPFLVWVETPDEVRLARGLARDGAALRDRWLAFMADERAAYAADGTRARARVVLDGVGRVVDTRAPSD